MEFIKTLFTQLQRHWAKLTTTQQIAFSAISIATLLFVIMIGWWSSRPQYMALADNLSPTQSAQLKSNLDAKNIPNRLNYGGSAILVPSSRMSEARLVAGDVVGTAGQTESRSGILQDPSDRTTRFIRQKEKSLEASLMRFKSIEWAKVEIAIPESSPFVREQTPSTASVTLEIRPGQLFTAQKAATVVELVAGGVNGLSPSNISVMDTNGNTLIGPSLGGSVVAQNFDHKNSLEARLAAKAERMLAQLLGPNKATVRVSADIDFTERRSESQVYDPDVKVTKKEQITSSKTTAVNPSAIGAPGTATNLGPPLGGAGSTPTALTSTDESIFDYENGSTKETTIIAAGVIKRLTISAIVDIPDSVNADPNADPSAATAAPSVTKTQIESVVKNAVGFDDSRGDRIEVVPAPLLGADSLVVTEDGGGWEWLSSLVANASLGIAAIVAYVLGMRMVKKVQPIEGTQSGGSRPADSARGRLLTELSEQAKQNPELVSSILSAWLNEEKADKGDDDDDDSPDLKVVRAAA